jgi:uncharacterized protein (DUF2141 family)
MKPLLLSALSWLAFAATAQAADLGTLTVTFTGLEPKGVVNLMIAPNADAYGGKGAAAVVERLTVTEATISKTYSGLMPGRYAIRAFHDVDGDGALDTNPFGIPIEPFGFSNNAKGAMGPPKWDDAGFDLAPGRNVQTISMN